jgi:hypothetical protein
VPQAALSNVVFRQLIHDVTNLPKAGFTIQRVRSRSLSCSRGGCESNPPPPGLVGAAVLKPGAYSRGTRRRSSDASGSLMAYNSAAEPPSRLGRVR